MNLLTEISLDMTLKDLILNARGESPHEPLTGDEVEQLAEDLREVINGFEGNT